MIKASTKQEDDEEVKRSLVREYLEVIYSF